MSRRDPLLASAPVSSLAAAPERAGQEPPAPSRLQSAGPFAGTADLLLGLGLTAGLLALAFVTTGGVDQVVTGPDTWAEIAVTLVGAAACATAVLLAGRGRAWGGVTVGLFALLTG